MRIVLSLSEIVQIVAEPLRRAGVLIDVETATYAYVNGHPEVSVETRGNPGLVGSGSASHGASDHDAVPLVLWLSETDYAFVREEIEDEGKDVFSGVRESSRLARIVRSHKRYLATHGPLPKNDSA